MNLLITAGGTKEPIDHIRYIGNFSTGQTGLFLTKAFLKAHHTVTLLMASDVKIPSNIGRLITSDRFTTYTDLKKLLKSHLSSHFFDGVLHLSAVGDYFVSDILMGKTHLKPQEGKITGGQTLTLKLKPHPKLLPYLKSFSKNKNIVVVGFKLTDTKNKQQEKFQVQKLLLDKNIDIVVHNRLSEVQGKQHTAQIYKKSGFIKKVTTKKDLSLALIEVISKEMASHS